MTDKKPDPRSYRTVSLYTLTGQVFFPAPTMLDEYNTTGKRVWKRLLENMRTLRTPKYMRRNYEKYALEQICDELAGILANEFGMAPLYWVMEADRLWEVEIKTNGKGPR